MILPATLSELDVKSAHLCLAVEKILREDIGALEKRHFLVCLSGGSDSTCLAVVLNILAARNHFQVTAIHFDHQYRLESREDANFVSGLCEALNMELIVVRFDMEKFSNSRKCGLEEAGHIARHNFCANFALKNKTDGIILAHHADDLSEDMLLRLIRGTGWPGLGGMRRRNGFFLRPFLFFPKRDLTDFLIREQIPWREDASNDSLKFRRNRLRHFIAPLLKKENPGFTRCVANLNRLADCDREYWDNLLSDFFTNIIIEDGGNYLRLHLDKNKIREKPQAMRLRIYMRAIETLLAPENIAGQARAESLFALDKTLAAGISGKIFQLPGGMAIEITKSFLIFQARTKSASAS